MSSKTREQGATEPSIALITVLYNGKENLPEFFQSLASQTAENLHLYMIDNSPEPDVLELALELARDLPFPITHHRNSENLGAAEGNNQGIRRALENGHDYLLLLNNDLHFGPDTIRSMAHHATSHGESILTPKFYNATTGKIWMAGGEMLHHRGINTNIGVHQEDRGQFDRMRHVEYAPTTFLLIHSEVFERVGLLDETYFAYFEDTDWVMRANRAGYRILYYPKALVHHKISATTGGKESDFSLYYLNRNRVYFIRKQYSGVRKAFALTGAAIEKLRWYRKASPEKRKTVRTAIRDGWRLPK